MAEPGPSGTAGTGRRRAWRRRLLASVRARTTAVAVLVVASVLLVWGASLVVTVGNSMDDDLTPEGMAADLIRRVEAGILPPVIALPDGEGQDDVFAQVVDGRGRVVSASENMRGQPPVREAGARPGTKWHATFDGMPTVDVDDEFEVVGIPARSPSGPVTVVVGGEVERVEQTVHSLRRALAVGGPVVLVVSAGLVWLLVGRSLRPVEDIRRQVASISNHASGWRVPEPLVEDEIGRLAQTMNRMLDRLESSSERQRRFVADASHELRSPLAVCRAQLEIAAAFPADTDYQAMVAELLDENHRMERLIADLAFLARRDELAPDPERSPVAVDELVAEEVRRRAPGPVAVDTTLASPAWVLGQSPHVGRVIRNLLDNATRHARSRVVVEAGREGPEVVLAVSDDGSGVPPEARQRIFDRFTRLDEARSRDEGGSGLGLAIVRDIVSGLGGRVWVEEATGGGARFVVALPACAQPEPQPQPTA